MFDKLSGGFAHGAQFVVEPVGVVAYFVANEFGVGELAAHFGGDGVGSGNASLFRFQAADRNSGAAAVEADWRVVLAVGGFEDFAVEGSVAGTDAFVVCGAVLPVWVSVGDFLEFCKLAGSECHGGFVAVDALCLKAVEPCDALFVEDFVGGFAPVAEAFAFGKGLCQAFFYGIGEFCVGDDGAAESFESVECCGVFVAEFEKAFFDGVGSGEGCAFVLLDPVVDARSAFAPGVV